jgi:hypothetical protein
MFDVCYLKKIGCNVKYFVIKVTKTNKMYTVPTDFARGVNGKLSKMMTMLICILQTEFRLNFSEKLHKEQNINFK